MGPSKPAMFRSARPTGADGENDIWFNQLGGTRIPGSTGSKVDPIAMEAGTGNGPAAVLLRRISNVEWVRRTSNVKKAWDLAARLYVVEAIKRHTTADFYEIVQAIIPGLLMAIGVVVTTTAVGAVVGAGLGSLAGGVGAGPGAGLGARLGLMVGMKILEYLGIGFLIAYVGKRLYIVGDHLARGIRLAWDSGGWGKRMEDKLIDDAAKEMAEAVGTFFSLLLQALVAYTAKEGFAKLKNTRLFQQCQGLENWLKNYVKRSRFKLPRVDRSTIPASWLLKPPLLSGGQPVKVYRGFARNVQRHTGQVVREEEVGGVLSRDPAAAHDAVFNQYGRDPVLSGPEQGGVVETTILPDLWDGLVQTLNIAERGNYPGFSRKLSTTEIRVNSPEAARLINGCPRRILPPDHRFDYRNR